MKAIAIVMLVIWSFGAILFSGAFSEYKAASMLLEQGIKAEGAVVNLKGWGRGSSKSNKPVIQFSDRNSNKIEFISEVAGSESLYTVGQKVEIFYLPENPQHAVINDYHSL